MKKMSDTKYTLKSSFNPTLNNKPKKSQKNLDMKNQFSLHFTFVRFFSDLQILTQLHF